LAEPRGVQYLVYVGTYTGAKSKGVYVYRMDAATGNMTPLGLAGETVSPSFLAIHPNERLLYAVNEVAESDGKKGGAVNSFSIDQATGKLTFINQQPSEGIAPCHLVVDKAGAVVLLANYGGSIAALPIQTNGELRQASSVLEHKGSGTNPVRQEGPHPHGIYLDPANKFAFVPDLGVDKVLIYRFDSSKAALLPNNPPSVSVNAGDGPRHFAFHPGGRYAYIISELHSTVTAFKYESRNGALKEIQTVTTLPNDFKGESTTAEIAVHPSGKFLYGSNRGHDSIAVFSINSHSGKLTALQHQSTLGKIPRHFGIDPAGKFLVAANQESDNLAVFRIDPRTGRLSPTGTVVNAPSPVCVVFVAPR
jgi:6-phosphogluconolactonase